MVPTKSRVLASLELTFRFTSLPRVRLFLELPLSGCKAGVKSKTAKAQKLLSPLSSSREENGNTELKRRVEMAATPQPQVKKPVAKQHAPKSVAKVAFLSAE